MNRHRVPEFEASAEISNAAKQDDGTLIHIVRSPFQAGETKIKVIVPDDSNGESRFKVVYVLPVEPHDGQYCGDPLEEIRKHGLHNAHDAMFVLPTFSHAPWYADHPSDPDIRQESHFLKVVVPFVIKTYPVCEGVEGQLLLGFSKSGWGACSLLLRHPETFWKAAAWDAPLAWESPNRYGMGEVFSTQENMNRYCITDLLDQRADLLKETPRLALLEFDTFRGHHQATHFQMLKLGILHEYQDGPSRDHRWDSGWLPDAVEFLARNDALQTTDDRQDT